MFKIKGKKGQAIFVGIMIVTMVFFTIVALIEPLKEGVVIARDVDHLDCDNTSISVGQSGACIIVDWYMFYFIGMAFAGGMAYLGLRFWQGNIKQGGG